MGTVSHLDYVLNTHMLGWRVRRKQSRGILACASGVLTRFLDRKRILRRLRMINARLWLLAE